MMVSTIEAKFTRREWDLLPEGFPAELIDGVLVRQPAPTPWHQGLVGRFYGLLLPLVGVERILVSPIDLYVDAYNILQPDVLVLPEGSRIPREGRDLPVPPLVIEVLSPSTASRDRDVKTGLYHRLGVGEVWLVDPKAESVEIHTPGGSRRIAGAETAAGAAVPGLEVSLTALFR